jgi:hypothetical protein
MRNSWTYSSNFHENLQTHSKIRRLGQKCFGGIPYGLRCIYPRTFSIVPLLFRITFYFIQMGAAHTINGLGHVSLSMLNNAHLDNTLIYNAAHECISL